MRTLPHNIGTVHFVGIGGIGMSGIAEVLKNLGYDVQGSDLADNANVKRLRALGVRVMIGHDAANVANAAVVVVSSAVKRDNPEVRAARETLIPVVRRAEMLGELMRLKWSIAIGGTHGKTTTTSMIGNMMEHAGLDPTVINGGIINAYGTNTRLGGGDWMVVEADESDGTFTKLPAGIVVVTNMDAEHLDHYGTFEKMRDAYDAFVQNIPFYGFAALCVDHPEVQAMIPRVSDRRVITYGFSPQADVRAINVEHGTEGARYDVILSDRVSGRTATVENVRLPMYGPHNVLNSLAAFAVGHRLEIEPVVMRDSMAKFQGVKRRFTRVGVSNGVTVIDDYGHHPVEIAAVLRAARTAGKGRTVAVVQPHRYSRLQNLFEEFCACFNEADTVIVADVYAAGEAPIEGVDKDALVEGLRSHGHRRALALPSPDDLPRLIAAEAKAGDLVVCLGAGSISGWANALPAALDKLHEGETPA